MKFFIDTADIAEIRAAHDMGLIDGVTTNPSLMAKTGRKVDDVMSDILGLVKGPVSLEVISTDHAGMMGEAEKLLTLGPQVVIKVPLTPDGLKSCRMLSQRGAKVNVTLCFTATQALLAAKAGAAYISPFIGRLDDVSTDGMQVIEHIRTIYDNYGFTTEILAASIRHPVHVLQAALVGADVATVPFSVIQQLFKHPLTDLGLEKFVADAKKIQKG
jgi:transaldolase